ncbi:MAG: HAD hydrolase-like protein [Alphaproteobacteria bacterium]
MRESHTLDLSAFKALLFDCYGTLIDWETGMANVARPWLEAMKSNVTTNLVLTAFAFVKWHHEQPRPAILFTELMRRSWIDLEGIFDFEPRPDRAEAFAQSIGDWPPFPDSASALLDLSRSYKLGIVSNIDNASIEKSKRRLNAPFAVTVTAEDVNSYKPHLAHFEEAFRQFAALGIRRDEILHVAQSRYHDIAPANVLGLRSVWVNRRHGKRGTGATIASDAVPDIIVTSLQDVTNIYRAQRAAAPA